MVLSMAVMKDKLLVDWRVWKRAEESVVLMAVLRVIFLADESADLTD